MKKYLLLGLLLLVQVTDTNANTWFKRKNNTIRTQNEYSTTGWIYYENMARPAEWLKYSIYYTYNSSMLRYQVTSFSGPKPYGSGSLYSNEGTIKPLSANSEAATKYNFNYYFELPVRFDKGSSRYVKVYLKIEKAPQRR
jgi:hypothetical protein